MLTLEQLRNGELAARKGGLYDVADCLRQTADARAAGITREDWLEMLGGWRGRTPGLRPIDSKDLEVLKKLDPRWTFAVVIDARWGPHRREYARLCQRLIDAEACFPLEEPHNPRLYERVPGGWRWRYACKRCGRSCLTQGEGDGVTRHTRDCLLLTAKEYDELAEKALHVNTHDRAFYLRSAQRAREEAELELQRSNSHAQSNHRTEPRDSD